MDNLVSESQDVMIDRLNFGLPETNPYIPDKGLVHYLRCGSNVHAPNASNKKGRCLH